MATKTEKIEVPVSIEAIEQIKTPERCEQYARNVEARNPEMARIARRRAVELRAQKYGGATAAERDAVRAVCAYERARTEMKGRTVHASRTWQMIRNRGIIPAVEYIVTRSKETEGYRTLIEMGMQDMAFEAVVLRHEHLFTEKAIAKSRERLASTP